MEQTLIQQIVTAIGTFAAPVGAGAVMVIIIDFIRKLFPLLDSRSIKLITVVVALVFALTIYLATISTEVEQWLEIFLIVIGTSQALFGFVWKDTEVHKDLVKGGVLPTE